MASYCWIISSSKEVWYIFKIIDFLLIWKTYKESCQMMWRFDTSTYLYIRNNLVFCVISSSLCRSRFTCIMMSQVWVKKAKHWILPFIGTERRHIYANKRVFSLSWNLCVLWQSLISRISTYCLQEFDSTYCNCDYILM